MSERQWPSIWYHPECITGRTFDHPEQVPYGWEATPAAFGFDTAGKPIEGRRLPEPEAAAPVEPAEPAADDDLPKRNRGGRPRKIRVPE